MSTTIVRARQPEATVRMGTVMSIPALLRSFNVDPEVVLGEIGCDVALFDNPDSRMSLAAHNRIVEHCARRTHCPHFGLLVGQQDGLESLGLVGLLVKHSPDVGTALERLVRHLAVHVRGACARLALTERLAMLTWELYAPGIGSPSNCVGDGAIAVYYNILHELCGPDWRPDEVHLARRTPADTGPYRRFFRVPLRFDAEEFALLFPRRWLAHRLPPVDDALRRLLQDQIDLLEAQSPGDFPEQVRSVLRTALATGRSKHRPDRGALRHAQPNADAPTERIRHELQQLLDETRLEISRQLLEESAMEVGRIAEILGYATHGAFTRAFRRWTGLAPVDWRSSRRSGP